ncbi:MAG TPA: hypothetical protein VM889_00080 [Candidatus Thermoplasmatota archaeon]|nr:hypothetical protein [Candidatus Thermoplasmatota archaeon]
MRRASASAAGPVERIRAEPSPLRAKLLLAGWLGAIGARVGFRPVVVGGTALDFYVAETLERSHPEGWLASLDLDVVSVSPGGVVPALPFLAALEREGFVLERFEDADDLARFGRAVRHPALPIAIEVLPEPLTGSLDHLVELEVDDYVVPLIAPEDLIVKYAESGAHFRHQREWTRALALARAQAGRLDLDYLRRRAEARGCRDEVERALRGEPLVR